MGLFRCSVISIIATVIAIDCILVAAIVVSIAAVAIVIGACCCCCRCCCYRCFNCCCCHCCCCLLLLLLLLLLPLLLSVLWRCFTHVRFLFQLSKEIEKEYLRNEICVTELKCDIVELKMKHFNEKNGIEN